MCESSSVGVFFYVVIPCSIAGYSDLWLCQEATTLTPSHFVDFFFTSACRANRFFEVNFNFGSRYVTSFTICRVIYITLLHVKDILTINIKMNKRAYCFLHEKWYDFIRALLNKWTALMFLFCPGSSLCLSVSVIKVCVGKGGVAFQSVPVKEAWPLCLSCLVKGSWPIC